MTEHEKIDHSRACFILGARAHGASMDYAQQLAALAFPCPKVTRPRVVTLPSGYRYRVEGGLLRVDRFGGELWEPSGHTIRSLMDERDDIVVLLRLFDQPTEEVDA